MDELVLHQRVIENSDWAALLFVLNFIIIAVNRNVFFARFSDFLNLIFSDKYNKIYKDSSNMLSAFTISMFVVQMISYTFFILLLLNRFSNFNKHSFVSFIQIVTFISVYVTSKYLIEKIIATIFKIEDFNDQFNLLKVNYRNYIAFLLLPVNLFLYYFEPNWDWIYIAIASTIMISNGLTYIISLKSYQNLLTSKIFYFILYLCTLEIAPYYLMYYWISKK